jgi:MFS family permease
MLARADEEGERPARHDVRFAHYLAAAASWFLGNGLQMVMLPWLLVGELRASGEWTGAAQMAGMLPTLALLLFGGAAGDRVDARRMLVAVHLLAALPAALLAACVASGRLGLGVVIGCAIASGAVNAFSFPARDSLLSRVAGRSVMSAVTGTTIAQFGAQGLGMAIAASARAAGSAPILALQALVVAAGALVSARLPAGPPVARPARLAPLELFAGVRYVWRSELRPVLFLISGIGFFFSGSYNVVLPLLVRDRYAGSVDQISLLLAMFPLGTIVGSFVLLALGGVRRKGRALILALASAACVLLVASRGLPFAGLVALTLAWGFAGSVFMNMGRALFQERAPTETRARVLSVNQLGFMAMSPLGMLSAGFVSGAFGPLAALAVNGAAMLALVGAVTLRSPVWRMR